MGMTMFPGIGMGIHGNDRIDGHVDKRTAGEGLHANGGAKRYVALERNDQTLRHRDITLKTDGLRNRQVRALNRIIHRFELGNSAV